MRPPRARAPVTDDGRTLAVAWACSAAALIATGRFGRRAVLRGSTSSLAVAGVAGLLGAVRDRRRSAPVAATAIAFAVGASLELPRASAPLAAATAAFLVPELSSRPRAPTSLLAAGAGAAIALGSRRLWPVAPHTSADLHPATATRHHLPAPEGKAFIGKWPAMIIALVGVLRRSSPTEVEIDGRTRRLWMIFVGNCTYHPHGFAPSWRTRLDDGRLDVRMIDASMPGGRLRLVAAVLTGRLGRCRAYEQIQVRELRIRRLDHDRRLARDGKTFDGSAEFTITKCPEPLLVYAPH